MKLQKLIKAVTGHFCYCKTANTWCMGLMFWNCFFANTRFYVFKW